MLSPLPNVLSKTFRFTVMVVSADRQNATWATGITVNAT